ncbi:GNAT family N-acetyltransferase [Mixta theicola]|uniref:GNAT family N-acetyltransferase n=1 Tax=Mixta theicola TaxID=1458355 RepID=A0A2K1QBY0_9GAMM|nr:GNAT family N-acetyltransferase [Mixta theicola]PNS12531.1 GNAT family N-acetyltransferase [Mixta theicola]GLR10090.1 GNAT family N-acetyltransferase [Mixta theicola]
MNIRPAQATDSFALISLLTELGYGDTESLMNSRLQQLIDDPDEMLMVAEDRQTVLGFLSLHFVPQLALAGDFARISYFCIAEGERSKGVGQHLLQHAEQLARERGCNRMEVHCHESRIKANQFYAREGYSESPSYRIKQLA